MSKLDDAVYGRMMQIVKDEHRYFSFRDFCEFTSRDKLYTISYGTFRNKMSKWMKCGKVERVNNGHRGFYTLKGCYFGNTMTENHPLDNSVISVTDSNLCDFIRNLPLGEKSIHDIHMKFIVPDIYKIISSSSKFNKCINPVSKDIKLDPIIKEGLEIQVVIHRTDTVTISVGCSSMPIPIDSLGINRLTNSLTRVEERLSRILDECGSNLGPYESIPIPDNSTWAVNMWHFGRDGATDYDGEKFCMSWKEAKDVLYRVYIKKWDKNRKRVRIEKQEIPRKSFRELVTEKLDENFDN